MSKKAKPAGIDDVIQQGATATDVQALPRKDLAPDRPLTDLGNSERLVARFGRDILWVPQWGWMVWDGRRWARDEGDVALMGSAALTVRSIYADAAKIADRDARAALVRHAQASEGRRRLEAMVMLAQHQRAAGPLDFDGDQWLLNVANGTLDLKTGQLRAHDHRDRITKLASVAYDPKAPAPTFEAFLRRITNDNPRLTGFLQRALGSALAGAPRDQILYICHGAGANGKSTLLGATGKVLGDYAQQAPADLFLAKSNGAIPNDVARLKGARFVTMIEVDGARRLAEALIKQLTGDDPVTARFLHREFFEFIPDATFFISANRRPNIQGTDHAIWRRVRLIPFEVVIPEDEQDRGLPDKLRAEGPGILAWLVRGCQTWQVEGLGVPDEVRAATEAYRRDQDILAGFLADCCVLDAGSAVPFAELYGAYGRWAESNGRPPLSAKTFGRILTDKGFAAEKDSKGTRIRKGLRLREVSGEASA